MAGARMDWMDTLRGGAVIAVVVLHAQLSTSAATGASLEPVRTVNELLAPVRMPLLMLLSGVLLARSLAKGLGRHVAGKARAILWPYAVWMVLDLTHVLVDSGVAGRPLPWHLVGEAFHDPPGYLWFLAYLFCFHLLAGVLPPTVRTIGVPLLFAVAASADLSGGTARFVALLPWFLLGDVLARGLAGRLPVRASLTANRMAWTPLAAVGRSSVVYYVAHMPVIVYAVPLLWSVAGLHSPWLVWAATVTLALGVARALASVQHAPGWRWLFAWPRRNVTEPTAGKRHFPVLRDAMSH